MQLQVLIVLIAQPLILLIMVLVLPVMMLLGTALIARKLALIASTVLHAILDFGLILQTIVVLLVLLLALPAQVQLSV